MKKKYIIMYAFCLMTYVVCAQDSLDDLFAQEEPVLFESSDTTVLKEQKLHPLWDAPTYIKIGFYYIYYMYIYPSYIAVMAYMKHNNKKSLSTTA